MTRKFFGFAVLLAAALTVFSAFDTAEARRGGGGYRGGGGHHGFAVRSFAGPRVYTYSGPRYYSGYRHVHVGPRYIRRGYYYGGVPLVAYGAYGGGCYWLKQKALYTGSHYWWHRYRACINGVYY
jgi:hypothetical protein